MQVAVLVNAVLRLRTILSSYNGRCIDIEILLKISIDIDRNIRIPHRNSTTFYATLIYFENMKKFVVADVTLLGRLLVFSFLV